MLACLYFVQGLPFGFQISALPLLLRAEGISLTGISFAGILALPWMTKIAWAPLVDRYYSERIGRRRSWMIPMQVLLALTCAVAALVGEQHLALLLVVLFFANFFAATLDIAVDGYAVDTLSPEQLGYGNIAQVVAYKIGMLCGGGLLVWFFGDQSWPSVFAAMGVIVTVVAMLTIGVFEPTRPSERAEQRKQEKREPVLATLLKLFRLPEARWIIAIVGSYKIGESISDLLFRPFLFDLGFSVSELSLWLSTWGMAFSIVGSFVGGWLASNTSVGRAIFYLSFVRAIPLVFQWYIATLASAPADAFIIAVTSAEHFFGGALTTAMFAFMMSRVDRSIGATHYTALATIEVVGKGSAGWAAGPLADYFGYPPLFALAALASIAFVGLLAVAPEETTA